MTSEDIHAYCAAKWGAWEDEPWEGDVVFKVGPGDRGKIDDELREAIDRSYELVVAGLPKKYRGPGAE